MKGYSVPNIQYHSRPKLSTIRIRGAAMEKDRHCHVVKKKQWPSKVSMHKQKCDTCKDILFKKKKKLMDIAAKIAKSKK